MTDADKSLSNHEIATIAIYLLGGSVERVDSEDIAIKVNELAPGRFTWRKYPAQINISNIRWAIWDAKKPENGGLVSGSEKTGWLLTQAGVAFAKKGLRKSRDANLARDPLRPKERQRLRVEKTRMLSSDAYEKIASGRTVALTVRDAEAFFRIDDYVSGGAAERKILRALNMFGDDPELGSAVHVLAEMIRKENGFNEPS